MDTGQMMAVMQQMPDSAGTTQAGTAVGPANPAGGIFSGLLQGLSMPKPAQVLAVGQAGLHNDSGLQTAPEIAADAMTTLLTLAGTGTKQDVLSDAQVEKTEQKVSEPESQNVMLDGSAAYMAMLFAQLHGRTPMVEKADNLPAVPPGKAQVDAAVSGALDGSMQIRDNQGTLMTVPAETGAVQADTAAATAAALPEVTPTVRAAAVPAIKPAMAADAAGMEALTAAQATDVIPANPQNEEATVIERDRPVAVKSGAILRATEVLPLVSQERGLRQAEVTSAQAGNLLQRAPGSQEQQNPATTRSEEVVAGTVFRAVPPLPTSAAVEQIVVGTENRALQLDPHEFQSRVAPLSPLPATSSLPTTAQETESPASVQQQTGVAAQQEQSQKMRTVTPLARQTEGTLPAAESQPEMIQARIDQREPTTSPLSEQPGTAKTMATAHSGASNTANSENETADRGMNGNFPSHVLHQQAKSESSSAVNAASGVVLDEVPRSNLPSEQVVQQVRDRFAAHEAKPGSEQIVLRLSPDHLGELKVNLNLEGQRLRVEIVAENRMVRDSLMQHTDALKESLSRQNIKMESFDVTTGGNSSTDSGRSQGDWRELAQQRQHNAWMPNGGYRVATQAVPAAAAYRIKSEHSMVDLHY